MSPTSPGRCARCAGPRGLPACAPGTGLMSKLPLDTSRKRDEVSDIGDERTVIRSG